MSSSDDKTFPVATKPRGARFRRSVSVNDFTLPKPYQKKPFIEDEPQMSTTRTALIGAAGLAAAGMVVAIAMVARENLATKPVLVIAAPLEIPQQLDEPPPPVEKARGALALAKPHSSGPAMAALGARDYPELRPALRPASRPALRAVSTRTARALRPAPPKPEPVVHDPDVELITAILLLSPLAKVDSASAAVAVCTPESQHDAGCPLAPHGIEP